MRVKKHRRQKYLFTQSVSLFFCLLFFFFLSFAARPWEEKEESRRRRPLFAARLLKRLYRAWQRGPACPSLVVLFILCAVQGVSNALGLCVGRETTHHILSSVPNWGMGGLREGAVQQRGDKKQTYRGPRLFKAAMHKGF